MSAKELDDKFKQWNPMENDYKNTKFNHYVTGPGAELDAELQPGQQALQNCNKANKDDNNAGKKQEQQAVPTLIFRHLPKDMTKKAMHNICSRHGRVKSVRDSTKNDYYFVDLATVADMEAVFRALEHNNYGFEVLVGKNKKPSDGERNKVNQNYSPVPPQNTGIDYQNRSYRTSKKQHPRPNVKEDSLINRNSASAVDTGLPLQLLTDDAHSLERQGLYKMPNNQKFNYRNGRSYVNMPENTKKFIEKKHNESSGTYNGTSNKYEHKPGNCVMAKDFDRCSVCFYACDTVCSRCSQHYCSAECQISDWPQHRYKCGKPKHLQKTPPPKKPNELNKNSSNNSKNTNNENLTTTKEKLTKNNESNSKQQLPSSSKGLVNKPTSLNGNDLQLPSSSKIATNPEKQPTNDSGNSTKSAAQQNMPRSGNIVTITAISKTNVVFIRSKTYDDNLSYFNTIDSLQAIGKLLQPLKSPPNCGRMVIAKFENQFNRALVLQATNDERILIIFVDYGNLEQMKLEDLYEAPDEFVSKPRHAIPVLLKDVPDLHMTQEIRKFMYTYLHNINVEIRYKPEDFLETNQIYAVELIDENTQQNLNKMIVKLSKPMEPQNSNEICNRGYLEQKVLPTGDDVEFFVMDNSLMSSGCISCTIKPYVIEIQKFQKELQTYAESIPEEAYTPRVDELCIARYSLDGLCNRWHLFRAVGDGHPLYILVDDGNMTIVPIENIRRYPRHHIYSIYLTICKLNILLCLGLPEECDDKLIAKLEQIIPNNEIIKCDNVTTIEGENFYIISLPNVIRELNVCGLLESDERVIKL
ncbi:LOW QUALITY PROTEIN: protein vreteno [Lucilia sericata]|uniref:LOW QUALITY PROTEIN: protein vreteno n=1 Tax=Lucilia sericata TaxID=13632 RepID=UPI0018A82921|nr:LOW QUALITY PROTEIN: protein vreteno [Lucilia sericata]